MTESGELVVRSPNWWLLGAGVGAIVVLVTALALAAGDGDAAAPVTTAPATTAAPPTTAVRTTTPPATTGPSQERLDPPWPSEPGLSLRPGVETLGGRLALAPWPDATNGTDDEAMWILDGRRNIGRFDLPTHPGDWPFPILFGGGGVAFVDQGAKVKIMSVDGSELTTLELDEPARYLVPAATPGDLWVVHDDFDLTFLAADGTTRSVETGGDAGWVLTGVADGVLALTTSEPIELRYVSTGGDARPVESVSDPQSTVIGASGDLIAVVEPGPTVVVIDVRVDQRIAEIPLDRSVTRACFSADRSHLAVADFAGDTPLSIVDLASGRRFDRWPDDHFGDMAWASETELVVLDGGRLVRLEADGDGDGIGLVTGPTWRSGTSATAWWIASERSPC